MAICTLWQQSLQKLIFGLCAKKSSYCPSGTLPPNMVHFKVLIVLGMLCYSVQSHVFFNELMVSPRQGQQFEYIELYNTESLPVDISGWNFTKGVVYTFPENSAISGKGYILVVTTKLLSPVPTQRFLCQPSSAILTEDYSRQVKVSNLTQLPVSSSPWSTASTC
jgi:hypothetical protein